MVGPHDRRGEVEVSRAIRRELALGLDDGETYDELAARVVPALVELGSAHDSGLVLAVTHAGPIRAALAASLGVSQSEARRRIGRLPNGALFHIAVRGGELHAGD